MTEKQAIHALEFLYYLKAKQEGAGKIDITIRKAGGEVIEQKQLSI